MFVEVLVELKAKNIVKTFTYAVPKQFETEIEVGKRVYVPFQNRELEGFILNVVTNQSYDYPIKDIVAVIDETPVLNEELLALGDYISKKTLCNLIHAYQTMLPTALKAKKGTLISKKFRKYLFLTNKKIEKCTEKQQLILELFDHQEQVLKKDATDISASAVNTLLKKGIIIEQEQEVYRMQTHTIVQTDKKELTDEQRQVLKSIQKNSFQPYLLYGVTGSGKTEVYMRLIEQVLEDKKEAILLVPEISLTPQLVETFSARFGSMIAILHSGLSHGEKYDEWRRIERKEVSIVIGARSAIFAPFTNLGIIIVDEEHSSTYKQENTPKYHAIDVALWRAKRHNIPLVLGSATPSIESYTRAKLGIYQLCTMKHRVNQNLPIVTCIDMKEEIRRNNRILSEPLRTKIEQTLSRGEQIILLLNRRGYTTINTCKACGYTHKCPACDIPLTYHKKSHKMRCHYCGYATALLSKCLECGEENMNQLGMGTEKLEQYLQEQFPTTSILRMDNDTTSTKGSHEKMITAFGRGDYQILLGTQMIAKGLNFPNVTLVGVLNGDATLNIPDFRSAERTFELLSQVAGRAGRSSLKGEVLIQGFHIDHYSIDKARHHDYEGFYEQEIAIRKQLRYPPYCNLCLITLKSKNEELAFTEGKKIASYLRQQLKQEIILGPSFSSMPKIDYVYQVQVIIKYQKTSDIYSQLVFLKHTYEQKQLLHVDIDLNPLHI